ncbi:MAG: transglycosylase domain-containing protein [Anaerolineae bacterium]
MGSRPIYLRRRRIRTEKHNKTNLPQFIFGFFGLSFFGALAVVVASILGAVALGFSYYNSVAAQLDIGALNRQTSQQFKTTKIYDRTGQTVLYELIDPNGGDRTIVPLARMPDTMKNATIALEDKTFWTNEGVDYVGLGRAALNMLRNQPLQGASTLTQQLVKKVLIPQRETDSRTNVDLKLKEIIWARELTNHYSKQQILEWYLNTVYYGNFAYGVEAASEAYFGKHVSEIDISEAATLAAIPEYPALNPIDNPDLAKQRRDITLDRMVIEGYITDRQAQQAKNEKIVIVQKQFDIKAPHFVFYVRKYLEDKYGPDIVNKGGLKVYTTLDYDMQQTAEQIARDQVTNLTKDKRNVTNASVVVIRPGTGEIMAMVGSVDYFNRAIDGQVNIATSARQPGSSFKMFSYLTAFSKGGLDGQPISPGTAVYDVRTAFDDPPNPPYVPENYDRKYHGPVRLRVALASSFNIPAVKVLNAAGIRNTLDMAHALGITTLNNDHYGLALTLGGGEVYLLDMTYAYSVLANGGIMAGQPVLPAQYQTGMRKLNPVSVLKVVDADGKTLEEYTKPQVDQIVTPQQSYLITDVLSDNNARAPGFGVNSVLKLTRPAAVKTGTTSAWRDNWTIGYTPDYAVGVWVGNSDNSEMEHISGITGAAPIWHDLMEHIHQNVPVHPFVEPPGMSHVDVCATSGLLPTPECPQVVKELFIKGKEPKQRDNIWQTFRIFRPNGKLATAFDPPDQVDTKVFPVYPPEAQDWVKQTNQPQAPTDFDTTYAASTAGGDLAILSPAPYSYIHGAVNIVGNAKISDLKEWQVAVGAGLDPTQWQSIGGGSGPVDNGTLATWNTTDNGLYTIQLTAVDHGGGPHTSTAQVTMDNKPPTVSLINPWDDKQYLLEDDEWVSIDADARDNLSMGKVDFFLDQLQIGTSKVAPFSFKWNITMSDPLSATLSSAATIPYTYASTDDQSKTITTTVSTPVTRKGARAIVTFPNGFGAIRDTGGYTETHTVMVKAYDAAGNMTASKAVRFLVSHRPPKNIQPQSSLIPLLGWARPQDVFFSLLGVASWWKKDNSGFLAYN